MKTDADVRRDVEAELRWAPDVDEKDIAVKVNEGEVTLSGFVRSYDQRHLAETAVKRVKGVTAVANDIEVRLPFAPPTDPQVARMTVDALKIVLPTCWGKITPVVKNGWVTLEGTVEWQYQRDAAERAVRAVQGVTLLTNSIALQPRVEARDIKNRIEGAFRRLAQVDANHIAISTCGSAVTLQGEVRSWAERDEAQRTAWAAPGVTEVMNQLSVRC